MQHQHSYLLIVLAVAFSPFQIFAKNKLNLYGGYGSIYARPVVAGQTTVNGSGMTGAALFDVASSKDLSWEIGFVVLNRKFQLSGVDKDWSYYQIAPLVRYYLLPAIFSLGASVYLAQRTTLDAEYRNSEIGGLFSARLEGDVFPSKVFGAGLFLEVRSIAGVLSFGSGTGVVHLDFQAFAGVRFGFV